MKITDFKIEQKFLQDEKIILSITEHSWLGLVRVKKQVCYCPSTRREPYMFYLDTGKDVPKHIKIDILDLYRASIIKEQIREQTAGSSVG